MNVELLRAIQSHIRKESTIFHMRCWNFCICAYAFTGCGDRILTPEEEAVLAQYQTVGGPSLGTLVTALRSLYGYKDSSEQGAGILGLTEEQARRLFSMRYWPSPFRPDIETEREAACRNIDWLIEDPENFEKGLPPRSRQEVSLVEEDERELVEA